MPLCFFSQAFTAEPLKVMIPSGLVTVDMRIATDRKGKVAKANGALLVLAMAAAAAVAAERVTGREANGMAAPAKAKLKAAKTTGERADFKMYILAAGAHSSFSVCPSAFVVKLPDFQSHLQMKCHNYDLRYFNF